MEPIKPMLNEPGSKPDPLRVGRSGSPTHCKMGQEPDPRPSSSMVASAGETDRDLAGRQFIRICLPYNIIEF
jgi:hypothetical protein